jgi:hypothetical protein
LKRPWIAHSTGPKRKRWRIDNSQFVNPIGIYEKHSHKQMNE